jgi:hypothetical protein
MECVAPSAGLARRCGGLGLREDCRKEDPDPLALCGSLEQLPSNFDSVTAGLHAAELVDVADGDRASDDRADQDGASAGYPETPLDGEIDIAHGRTIRSRR